MAENYYIRPRKEENPKRWQGPFDVAQLKDLADRRMFSKELHECSEDRLNWIPARQIWPELFPKAAKPIAAPVPPAAYLPVAPRPTNSQEAKAPAKTSDSPGRKETSAKEVEPTQEWFYALNGQQEGPVTLEQLRELADRRRIQPTDLVWSPQFGNQWVEARLVAEIYPPVDLSAAPSSQSNSRLGLLVIAVGLIVLILITYCVYLLISKIRY